MPWELVVAALLLLVLGAVAVPVFRFFSKPQRELRRWKREASRWKAGDEVRRRWSQRRVLALVNPAGGHQLGQVIFREVFEVMAREAGVNKLMNVETKRALHARDIVRARGEEFDVVVLISGDGVLAEAVNGLLSGRNPETDDVRFPIPLCVIPAGTMNGLTSSLGHFDDAFAATRALFEADAPRPVDLMHVRFLEQSRSVARDESHGFHVVDSTLAEHGLWEVMHVSAGAIAAHDHLQEYRLRGYPFRELLSPLIVIGDNKAFQATIHLEPLPREEEAQHCRENPLLRSTSSLRDSTEVSGWKQLDGPRMIATLVDAPRPAHDAHLVPHAVMDDGVMDLIVTPALSRLGALGLFLKLESGNHVKDTQTVHCFRSRRVRIVPGDNSSCLSVGGELYPELPIEVSVHQRAGLFY
jgi:diacylglycerol kinase family enzyme